jgi:hypothetical protein
LVYSFLRVGMASRTKQAPSKKAAAPPVLITTQDAINMLNTRLLALEQKFTHHMAAIEAKLGENDTFVLDNTPDMEGITDSISIINTRLLDISELESRVANLEASRDPEAEPTNSFSQVLPPKTPRKKGGTVKLGDA